MNKTVKILLIALASFVIVGAVAFTIYYINVNTISFDYVSRHSTSDHASTVIPYFGNKLTLEENGVMYSALFNLGAKNLDVYDAVNGPIGFYSLLITTKYDRVDLTEYEVKNDDGKTLTVTLSGTGKSGGETVDIEKIFVFDIENASLDKLPVWTNIIEDDEVDEEILYYLHL